jgi:hypothetical protein
MLLLLLLIGVSAAVALATCGHGEVEQDTQLTPFDPLR